MVSCSMRKPLFKAGLTILAGIILSLLLLGAKIVLHSQTVTAGKYDCALVLGAGVNGSTPSPVFQSRIDHAVTLFRAGIVSHLLFTGGSSDGKELAESEAGRSSAIAQGIPSQAIFTEIKSRTTFQNLTEAGSIMKQQGLTSAVIVSDPLHLYRASRMAADLQITAVTSGSPSTRYVTLKTQIPFLLREIFFTIYFSLFTE